MSRRFEASSGNAYFHNGDFSGDVNWEFNHLPSGKKVHVAIPFEDMKELVAEYIRQKKISDIENASVESLLED